MHLTDTITLDGVRRTGDGYLTANARVARTGVQVYSGREVGKPDLAQVRVYRPPAEVFADEAMHSFAHRPITIEHPPEAVTADNWRTLAVGQTGDEVAQEGRFIRVPLVLMDAKAIKAVENGKRELSMGYTTEVLFEAGVTPEGEAYDAVQTQIRANHLAVVSAARGGSELRIGDEERNRSMTTRTIVVDGLSVELADKDAQIVQRALDAAAKTIVDAQAKATADATRIGELTAQVSTKDGEIAALTQKLADATAPAALDAAVAARGIVVTAAKKILGDSFVTDGKTDAELRKAAVEAKLGDAAKGMSEAEINGAFKVLADVKPGAAVDPLARTLADGPVNIGDARTKAEEARRKRDDDLRNGYKPKAA